MRLLLFVALIASNAIALADTETDAQIKNAVLTVSAFECVAVSTSPKDKFRLLTLGLNAGREFIKYVKSHPDIYLNVLRFKVPIYWELHGGLFSGPTPDFTLGQVYQDRVHEMEEKIRVDKEGWMEQMKAQMKAMYREKNCTFLDK